MPRVGDPVSVEAIGHSNGQVYQRDCLQCCRVDRVQYSVLGVNGRVRRTVDIECAGSPAMHSFSLTENYVVVYDFPVTFDPEVISAEVEYRLHSSLR